jgi:negative regulator of sigma E activity
LAIVAMVAVLVIVGVALLVRGGDHPASTTTTTTIAATPTTGPRGPAVTGAAPAPISRALHRLEELTKP